MAPVGVKTLVDAGISQVPEEYLQPSDRKGETEAAAASIPVIDLTEIRSSGDGRQRVVQALRAACSSTWGFFELRGHGVPNELIDRMLEAVHQVFNHDSRFDFYSEDHNKRFRYGTSFVPSKEQTKQWQDFLHHSISPECPIDELPSNPSLYKDVSLEYGNWMKALAEQLLELFSESLGLEPGALKEKFDGERLTMRINYYPPCPDPEKVIGLHPHSDPNAFTILLQESPGLQVFHDGSWVNIKPANGAFVVNIGDQLQILSNDLFKSVEHRALVNSSRVRVSIATFHGPSPAALIAPMPQLVSETSPAIFRESSYGDYLKAFYSKSLNSKSALDMVKLI